MSKIRFKKDYIYEIYDVDNGNYFMVIEEIDDKIWYPVRATFLSGDLSGASKYWNSEIDSRYAREIGHKSDNLEYFL